MLLLEMTANPGNFFTKKSKEFPDFSAKKFFSARKKKILDAMLIALTPA